MTFQSQDWLDCENEIRDLVADHWEELAMFKDKVPLSIMWDRYRDCAERGLLQLTTARLERGALAGYWISIVDRHLHYGDTLFAFQDSYFLLPKYRTANVGIQLMLEMEKNVKAMGAQVMIGSDKEHLSMEPLFEFVKWKSVGHQYMKWIGGD